MTQSKQIKSRLAAENKQEIHGNTTEKVVGFSSKVF